jgi:hypothetical protein
VSYLFPEWGSEVLLVRGVPHLLECCVSLGVCVSYAGASFAACFRHGDGDYPEGGREERAPQPFKWQWGANVGNFRIIETIRRSVGRRYTRL